MNTNARQHAIVIGASIAGLLAARVLADHFAQVTLLERDQLPDGPGTRKGVPQGTQPHALLLRGKQNLEGLFPGLQDELLRAGALMGDMTGNGRIASGSTYLARYDSGLPLLYASRPLIERVVRGRTLALPNVRVQQGVAVQGLLTTPDRARVVGVHLKDARGEPEVLHADLVMDASGRGTRTPAWLESLGYDRPPESRLQVNVTYTSRLYHRKPEHRGGDLMFGTFPDQPKDRQVAAFLAVEGDRWHVMYAGWHGVQAPADDQGFLAFARNFEHPEIHEFLSTLEPASDFAVHKYPANARRHFERLGRFPDGLLVIGDALCSFNPTYGQGITVSTLEALALQGALKATTDSTQLRRRYFRAASKAIDLPWSMVTGGDGSYPESQWKQPLAARLTGRYFNLAQRAAVHDGVVLSTFFQVQHMVKPPTAFFAPAFVLRVLRAARMNRPAPNAATGTPAKA
jgi:2-polyprenyl-6-methoxyphenol hydroxylase-like FAD-dependent oxidoreductase